MARLHPQSHGCIVGHRLLLHRSLDVGWTRPFYVLFLTKLDTREVHIDGITSTPNEQWMKQIARNLTMEEWGVLKPGQYLIHDEIRSSVRHADRYSMTRVSTGLSSIMVE